MKLLIIRHGDPDYALDSLTPVGFREAELLVKRLEKQNIKSFFVSPLGRAQATIKPTLEKLGKSATTLDWLREFPVVIEGKNNRPGHSCAWDWLPEIWTADQNCFDKDNWVEFKAFQSTDAKQKYKEVCDGLDALLAGNGYRRDGSIYRAERANEDTVALVCHFGLECVLLSHLLNISPMLLWHGLCAAPSSVTTLVTEERREGITYFRMLSFGDTSHLYVENVEPSFAARFCETFDSQDQRHD